MGEFETEIDGCYAPMHTDLEEKNCKNISIKIIYAPKSIQKQLYHTCSRTSALYFNKNITIIGKYEGNNLQKYVEINKIKQNYYMKWGNYNINNI